MYVNNKPIIDNWKGQYNNTRVYSRMHKYIQQLYLISL